MITAGIRFFTFSLVAGLVGCGPASKSDILEKTPTATIDPPAVKLVANVAAGPKVNDEMRSIDELLLFFPAKYPDGDWQPNGLRFEDVWFQAKDGTKLHGWYCPCDNPRAVLLFAHGNAGHLAHRAPRMKRFQDELRVTSFIFDYRGYGRSRGTPTVDGILQDARAARKVLAERANIDQSQIVLMGESLGGAVAVDLAADGARALILESTFSSLRDIAAYHYSKLAWIVSKSKLDSVSRIRKVHAPLFQSHGDPDQVIPITYGQKLFDAANEPKQFYRMVGVDHNDPKPAEYWQKLERFIAALNGTNK